MAFEWFRRRRSVVILIGLAVIAAIALAARELGHTSAPQGRAAMQPVIPATTAVATRQDVPNVVNAIGAVQSIDSVAVQPRVTGAIMKIEFTPGQDVKEGQEMFLIDPRPYQAALDLARAQLTHDEAVLEEAQLDLTRYQTLQKQQSIAGQQAQDQSFVVEQDKGTVQLDQANVETAQLNLEYCHIAAPIAGRVGTLQVDLGNIVGPTTGIGTATTSQASTGLVTITQLQPIYVTFSVPQTYLMQILHNQAADALEVDAYSQAGPLIDKGKLAVINNQVAAATGTATLQAMFANTDNALWPGAFVRVNLILEIMRNVVTVPTTAVMTGPTGPYVYTVSPDNTAHNVKVDVIARLNQIAVIGKGLSGDERVVTEGQIRLKDGAKVEIRDTSAPAAEVSRR